MQQQLPTRGMDDQRIIPNPGGVLCYRCTTCRDVFTSSQGLAGHQNKHKFESTWIRDAPHEKFFCPSTELPALYLQLGTRKSTPTVLRGHGHFYHLRRRSQTVYGPRRKPGRPRAGLYEPQQTMVLQVAPVFEGSPISPLLIQDQNLFAARPYQLVEKNYIDDKEEIDLELRL